MKAVLADSEVWSSTKDTVVLMDYEGGERAITWLSKVSKELGDMLAQSVCSNDFRFKGSAGHGVLHAWPSAV